MIVSSHVCVWYSFGGVGVGFASYDIIGMFLFWSFLFPFPCRLFPFLAFQQVHAFDATITGLIALQVTSMVATGPRPPMTMGNSDGDEPLKINIGEGMMGTLALSRTLPSGSLY